MIQVWTALITILILKFLKALAKYRWQLSNLIAFIRLNLFVKIDLKKWLDKPFDHPPDRLKNQQQGVLFDSCHSISRYPALVADGYITLNRLGHYWIPSGDLFETGTLA